MARVRAERGRGGEEKVWERGRNGGREVGERRGVGEKATWD